MGVYIKGMEMPVTCCHCPLMGYDPDIEWNDGGRETQGAYICVLTGELIDNTKREDHCPLVEIPPHGDLIERKTAYDSLLNGMVMTGYQSRALECIDEFHAPTIIPASEEGET